jgi:tetratricopeptide (TPR) repeat protein
VNRVIEKKNVAIFIAVYFLISCSTGSAQSLDPSSAFSLSPKQKAELFIDRKQYAEAINAYQSLLKETDADSTLFRGLVRAYRGAHRLQEAEAFIRDFLSSHPDSSAGYYGLGYCHYLKEEDLRAQENFTKAIQFDDKNALAWNNLGASLSRTKSYTFAVAKVKQAIRLEPSNPMFYNNLSRVYREMGGAGLFFADYKRYVRVGPKLVAQGYGRVIAKTLRQEAFRQFSQGNLDATFKKFSDAAEIYKEIDHQPGLIATYFGLGILYEENGDEAMAQRYFQKVLSINPKHLQAREKVK